MIYRWEPPFPGSSGATKPPVPFELHAGACQVRDMEVFASGVIQEYQGKQDFFKFVHITSGEYLIVVNPDDSLDPKFPYRRTFFPGVHDRAAVAPSRFEEASRSRMRISGLSSSSHRAISQLA